MAAVLSKARSTRNTRPDGVAVVEVAFPPLCSRWQQTLVRPSHFQPLYPILPAKVICWVNVLTVQASNHTKAHRQRTAKLVGFTEPAATDAAENLWQTESGRTGVTRFTTRVLCIQDDAQGGWGVTNGRCSSCIFRSEAVLLICSRLFWFCGDATRPWHRTVKCHFLP